MKTCIIFFVLTVFLTVIVAQEKKPNVLIIVSDDHAYQAIGAYGSKLARTPQIDRIAYKGAHFIRRL